MEGNKEVLEKEMINYLVRKMISEEYSNKTTEWKTHGPSFQLRHLLHNVLGYKLFHDKLNLLFTKCPNPYLCSAPDKSRCVSLVKGFRSMSKYFVSLTLKSCMTSR